MIEVWKRVGGFLLALAVSSATVALVGTMVWGRSITSQLTREVDGHVRVIIQGSHAPMARRENDAGRVQSGIQLHGISIVFKRTPVQETGLQALIAAQQNPAAKSYHRWLTPEQFAARFGASDDEIASVESWLEQEGFSIDSVSRSKNRIFFSGGVEQVEAAFGTEMHYYRANGETNYAPFDDVTVPAALSSAVETVTGLSTFRPKPYLRVRAPHPAQPLFTSSQSGGHFLTPTDIATIYDINAAYSAGFTGADQSMAVVGQSAIEVSDIENFQAAAGLATRAPTQIPVPGSGSSTIYRDDEAESDLGLEYAGGVSPPEQQATLFMLATIKIIPRSILSATQLTTERLRSSA